MYINIISVLVAANDEVSKMLTIMFNPKTLRLIMDLGSVKINWDQLIVLSISVYNFRNITSIQLVGHDI